MALQVSDDKLQFYTQTSMPIRIKHYAIGTNAIYSTLSLVLNFYKRNMHFLSLT